MERLGRKDREFGSQNSLTYVCALQMELAAFKSMGDKAQYTLVGYQMDDERLITPTSLS